MLVIRQKFDIVFARVNNDFAGGSREIIVQSIPRRISVTIKGRRHPVTAPSGTYHNRGEWIARLSKKVVALERVYLDSDTNPSSILGDCG